MHFTFPGGEMEPIEGSVTALDPPRRFSFTWGDEHLHIELEPDGDGCRLRFTQVLSTREQASRDAAGWHVCLDSARRPAVRRRGRGARHRGHGRVERALRGVPAPRRARGRADPGRLVTPGSSRSSHSKRRP